jgi:hypothetical protein
VDRRALPEPETGRDEKASEFLAPRTPVEAALAEIWAAVLEIERVGAEDNFFELGGQSLLAMQVIARIAEIMQVDLPFRSIFELPRLAELAQLVELYREQVLPSPPSAEGVG